MHQGNGRKCTCELDLWLWPEVLPLQIQFFWCSSRFPLRKGSNILLFMLIVTYRLRLLTYIVPPTTTQRNIVGLYFHDIKLVSALRIRQCAKNLA